MIESSYTLNKFYIDYLSPRIQAIFKQQKLDNKEYNFEEKFELLRFKIYFLGTIEKSFQSF
jgi:hypothetical protein